MIIAVCGLAGAGKTTSLDILERLGMGAKVYVGAFVTAEVSRRGMEPTPQSEREVREDLRNKRGMAALAELAMPTIQGILGAGRVALVDAIYCAEEFEFYRDRCNVQVVRIAIVTVRHERVRRLAARSIRPLDAEALDRRDDFELTRLGLEGVIRAAEYKLDNDGSLDNLESTLARMIIPLGGDTIPSLSS